MTKLLTESEGLVPATGEYTMRYCCTGPGAGSQRTSRLLGVGLYTWIFLASPLTTGERKANAYFSCLFTHVTLFITLPQVTLSNRIKSYPLYTAIYTRKHTKNSPNTKLPFANVESMLFSIKNKWIWATGLGWPWKDMGLGKGNRRSRWVSSKVMGPEERFYTACLPTNRRCGALQIQSAASSHSSFHLFLPYSTLAMEYLPWFTF